jgi:transcriptional regulator GlxA family with amidase domain
MRLIREHAGDDVARRAARVTLVADNRISQEPYIDALLVAASSPGFATSVQRHLVEHLDEPYDLAALARAFNVSTRTMLRRFAAECGRSPLDYLQAARVDAAKRLLESTSWSVAQVMEQVGYRDVGTFRRLFADHVGATPAAYRRQFGVRS